MSGVGDGVVDAFDANGLEGGADLLVEEDAMSEVGGEFAVRIAKEGDVVRLDGVVDAVAAIRAVDICHD